MRDFIWIDPDASFVPPFNPLHFNSPEGLELGKESLFTTFKSLAGSIWAANRPGAPATGDCRFAQERERIDDQLAQLGHEQRKKRGRPLKNQQDAPCSQALDM
jgi:hypothetical protein